VRRYRVELQSRISMHGVHAVMSHRCCQHGRCDRVPVGTGSSLGAACAALLSDWLSAVASSSSAPERCSAGLASACVSCTELVSSGLPSACTTASNT
jgi:hypothetical protein